MLQTNKIIPAVVVVVFLIQGAISAPAPNPNSKKLFYFGDDFPNPFDGNRLEDDPPINALHLLDEPADWLKNTKFEAPELAQV
ncbi:hypothetical protein AVEN_145262-1 [Araneus ventricosus]|uniref:Uncharacterized protein n=1 Tax=Araneus ventricosus TaxID=182803 RepID=A0A4Y2PVN8_ARAVE|nr:hypothetical protein AVEN_145262-1 [Araneus ventricosus]